MVSSNGNILVVAEHLNGELRKVTLPTITFAQSLKEELSGELIGLVLGSGVDDVARQMSMYGFDRVIYVDDPSFHHALAESYAPAVSEIAREVGAGLVCGAASMEGKDYLPRVASELGAGMVSDCTAAWSEGADSPGLRFKRPMWAGNIIATVAVSTPVAVVSVRNTAFEPATPSGQASVETRQMSKNSPVSQYLSFEAVHSERPDLTDASTVISGGRGLREAENFKMLEKLADLLGGAIGASRAAVDSGMAPNELQIGQTGKIVAPDLYVAIAISGAIQHLAGMKSSKTIVAINKDPEAPIFQVADYGLVADAFTAVPELTQKIEAIKAAG